MELNSDQIKALMYFRQNNVSVTDATRIGGREIAEGLADSRHLKHYYLFDDANAFRYEITTKGIIAALEAEVAALKAERDEAVKRGDEYAARYIAVKTKLDSADVEREQLLTLLQEAEETTVRISGITFEAARNPVLAAHSEAVEPVYRASDIATDLHIKLLTTLASKK